MEDLLNKLIKRGWKPFNVNCDWTDVEVVNRLNDNRYIPEHTKIIFKTETHRHVFDCDIRDLVSKSSGLWQFVCDNNLNYSEDDSIYNVWLKHYAEDDHESPYTYASPAWYIIEASLKDERELEQFLLDNIKIDEKKS